MHVESVGFQDSNLIYPARFRAHKKTQSCQERKTWNICLDILLFITMETLVHFYILSTICSVTSKLVLTFLRTHQQTITSFF